MKKLTLLIGLMLAVYISAGAQTTQILLQHGKDLTMFDADKMADAMTKAADGDTVYLNEGTFTGDFTITKAISIIGAGQTSVIKGNITISIPNNPTLTARLLDGLWVSGNISTALSVKHLVFRKCRFNSLSFSGNIENCILDRCLGFDGNNATPTLRLTSNVISLTAVNSDFFWVNGTGKDNLAVVFQHCNIRRIQGVAGDDSSVSGYPGFKAVLTNCIIEGVMYCNSKKNYPNYSGGLASPQIQMSYCLYTGTADAISCFSLASQTSCYKLDADNATSPVDLTTEYLQNNNYYGDDGTLVGMYGGDNPYTLDVSVPRIKSSTYKIDKENQKLNVSVKISVE